MDSVLDQSRASDKPPIVHGHNATNAEHPARARRPRWQDEDLVITATPKGRTVQHQPLSAPTESMPRTYPFELVGADPIYQDAMHHLFADHAERPAHARRLRWQDEDLVITATLEGRTIQRRPFPAPTESMPKPYSFGLVGAGPIC